MAKVDKVTIQLQLKGFAGIKGIGKDFEKFTSTVKVTKPQLDKFIKGITKVHGNTKLSKAAFEGQIAALTKLKNNVGIGTVAYQRLGVELDKVRAKMNAVTNAGKPQGGMFAKLQARFNKIPVGGRAALGALAGTATAGLGSTGQLAFTGGAVGGPAGALIGGGIGAAMDTTRFAGESAKYAAQIQKLRIALQGVTKDQQTFEYGLNVISRVSKELNVPIAESTKQFTTLSASVLGAGGTIEDAELVFEGVSSAIKATGGSADDVQSAIRAMSQIFGKGKVSAEELQGQLGERLAGAVVKFAEANGSSLQKLQKDLRDGTVGLDQVIKFAQKLNTDFGETAREVANSSADAGARLKVQMDDLKLVVGEAVLPIGAAFQRAFADIAKGILDNQELMDVLAGLLKTIGIAAFATFAAIRFLTRSLVDLAKILYHIANFEFKKAFDVMKKGFKDTADNAKKDFQSIGEVDLFGKKSLKRNLGTYTVNGITYDAATGMPIKKPSGLPKLTGDPEGKELTKIQDKNLELRRGITLKQIEDETDRKILERKYEFIDAIKEAKTIEDETEQAKRIALVTEDFRIDKQNILNDALKKGKENAFDFAEEFKKLAEETMNIKDQVGQLALDVTDKLGDAFADFFIEGKRGFADLARSAIQELQRIIIKATFMRFIANPIMKSLNLVKSADGNVFAQNKIVPYRMGGIVDKPTIFPMANGAGLMGEAGPEAIMPLKRGKDGKLGVESSGGIGNINVNVDASGSSAQGDDSKGRQLGEVIAKAIQAELVEQKRPGGILS